MQLLNYGLKQTVRHLVEITILILFISTQNMGCLNYRKKIQKFGLFLPTGLYCIAKYHLATIARQWLLIILIVQLLSFKFLLLSKGHYATGWQAVVFGINSSRTVNRKGKSAQLLAHNKMLK